MTYFYNHNPHGNPRREDGAYDEPTREIIRDNVSRSMKLDAERGRLAPSAPTLRARVLAATNGRPR